MASIALTLMLCGDRLDLSPHEAQNLRRWLAGVEGKALPQNNWLFFRALVQAAFRRMGWPWNRDYLYWFEDGGRAVPFGRSLTYRFGQCAFFSALAFAGVEALPWGVVKSRVLGNLRDWFAQPIFSSR